jgi:hypothetical protein
MKSFQEYLAESEHSFYNPVAGDDFAINIREEFLLETYVLEETEDGIVLHADDKTMSVLEGYGLLEQSTLSQRAQAAFADLDDIQAGVKPATATTQDLEQGRLRAQQGHAGTPISRGSMSDLDKFSLDKKFLKVPPGTSFDDWKSTQSNEAKYQGREVSLGKPMAGDVKKSKVYVRGPKGNVVKVNFGDKTMKIKKSNPARRKSFRARHNCDNPGPRWKARYWSCRAW